MENRTELAIAAGLYEALLAAGGGIPASPINLVSGERSCFSHGAPTGRRLRSGDFGSAIGRRLLTGATRLPSGGSSASAHPRRACLKLYDCRHGVVGCDDRDNSGRRASHSAARSGAAGHHGGWPRALSPPHLRLRARARVSPTWGEPLHMIGDSAYTLRAGMVVTIEPPIFIGEERLGARIIDNVLVTGSGAELLSRFNRDLIVTS